MNKTTKRILAIALSVVLTAGALVGVLYFLGNRKRTVNVYDVTEVAMDSYWGDQNETSGSVRYDRMQALYLSDTQIVTGVHVEKGQQVTAGTPLLSVDTTLTDIKLQRQELSVTKLEVEMKQAREELRRVSNLKPYVAPTPTPEPPKPEKHPIPEEDLPYLVDGTEGTLDNPYVFICEDGMTYTPDLVEAMLIGKTECWAVFQVREDNAPEGDVQKQWALRFSQDENGNVSFSMIDAESILPEEPSQEPAPEPEDNSVGYTAQELAQMKKELNEKIAKLDLDARLARVELERMRLEMTTGTITAQFDGVIVDVLEEKDAREQKKPIVLLSGGGGYYVDCTIGELDLLTTKVGQHVTVNSWESGGTFEGEIAAISDVPSTSNDYYGGSGNPSVSRYPVSVRIDADATLREGEYVSVTMGANEEGVQNGFYLTNGFIRTQSGKSYVYIMGEDGKLEKRFIKTGKNIWGSYTQVFSGVTMDDKIAFPYGRSVKEGAECTPSDISALYEGM